MRTSKLLDYRTLSLLAVPLIALCFSLASTRAFATDSPDDHLLDQQGIEALEARALHADPRQQCFLFAQVLHQLTELSAQKYADGDFEKASSALRQIQEFAHRMNAQLTGNDKRLKNAEILLRHTAFRLRELLHNSTAEDQPLVKQTLAQIDNLDSSAMLEVFKK